MRSISILLSILLFCSYSVGQTLNVSVGGITYQFPSSQTGEMSYSNGTSLTIMGKEFSISDIDKMFVDETPVTDGSVNVVYNDQSASVYVAGNIARYITPAISGAHVSITQSDELAEEITYNLSGASGDGEFFMSGSYKATIELNGLSLTNKAPVYSGAAIDIQNGKRIKVKAVNGTVNYLEDAVQGSQKGCLYIKGHAEFAQTGTLNITGNVKHGVKTGEYLTLKNATINILSTVGDGISCNEYFLMESGAIKIANTGDDGIQCDLDGDVSTGETGEHEDEDSGNIYISGGVLDIVTSAIAAKGIKCDGDINISGGDITVKTTGKGEWDSEDQETKAACCISCDGNINIIGDCTVNLTSTGSGGKGMKCDGVLTITDGKIDIVTSGGLYYNNGTTENTNFTGDTDRISNDYYSSPKGIKAGIKAENGYSYTYSGGIEITGGNVTVTTSGRNGEGIESKNYLNITGGHITVNAYDDAINSGQDLTISGGYVYALSSNNDGIDANGNCYVKDGVIYAIGSRAPEVAIDANSEEGKKLFFTGGTLVAIGGLESGSSLTQPCYSASSWNRNTWYALYNGNDVALVFKTPDNGGNTLVISTSGDTSLKSGVTVNGGTEYFEGAAIIGATVSGGNAINLSQYTSNGGNRPGGGGGPGGH